MPRFPQLHGQLVKLDGWPRGKTIDHMAGTQKCRLILQVDANLTREQLVHLRGLVLEDTLMLVLDEVER